MSSVTSPQQAPFAVAVAAKLMTAEELLAIPEDQIERSLIRGQLRERPMTKRNRFQAAAESKLAFLLHAWVNQQPDPRGHVFSGEVGCILRRDPDTTVGIDVAYVSAKSMASPSAASTMLEGSPTLVAEILSPADTLEDIHEKIGEYLRSGVGIVWIVDPYFKTVTVHRTGFEPELFNREMLLSAVPQLPSFSIAVRSIFE